MNAAEKSSPARLIVLDLIAFVLMASAMGLIAAIALAAAALLFASQAQANETRAANLVMRRVESREAIRAPLHSTEVALRVSPARASDAPLKEAAMLTNLPEGWDYDKVLGARHGELPHRATENRFALLSGLLALLLGMLMLLVARRRRPT